MRRVAWESRGARLEEQRKAAEDKLDEELAALSPEELEARIERDEKALAEINEVLERHRQWTESPEGIQAWEDLQVLALKMNDALDDLNDKLREVEQKFLQRKLRPGWVAFSEGQLIWNGQSLIFDNNGKQQSPLVNASKKIRLAAVEALQPLLDELTRERQPV